MRMDRRHHRGGQPVWRGDHPGSGPCAPRAGPWTGGRPRRWRCGRPRRRSDPPAPGPGSRRCWRWRRRSPTPRPRSRNRRMGAPRRVGDRFPSQRIGPDPGTDPMSPMMQPRPGRRRRSTVPLPRSEACRRPGPPRAGHPGPGRSRSRPSRAGRGGAAAGGSAICAWSAVNMPGFRRFASAAGGSHQPVRRTRRTTASSPPWRNAGWLRAVRQRSARAGFRSMRPSPQSSHSMPHFTDHSCHSQLM